MSTINPQYTAEEIMEVPCIICDAQVGDRCFEKNQSVMLGFHAERLELREKVPALPLHERLTKEDKSLIVHYAFVIMADSVSAKSVELFGKHFSSAEIQRSFCARAIAEAKKDGLLK